MAPKRKAPPTDRITRLRKKQALIDRKNLNAKSALLKLPTELQNVVYEYSLLSEPMIPITKELKQPPLLQACRQVRKATLHLWYQSQSFNIDISECDASLLTAFVKHAIAVVGQEVELKIGIGVVDAGGNWANLEE